MTTKIAIIGAQGTGKTTLITELKKELKRRGKTVETVDEVARSSPWAINEQANFQSQRWIFHAQILAELEAEYKNPDIILYDRGVIDNLAYTERLQTPHEPFPITEYLQMVEIARYLSRKYDYIIHLPFDLSRLKDDGVRSTNVEFAKDIDVRIRGLIKNFNIKVIKYKKNFNISKFCNEFAPEKKLKKVTLRKRNNIKFKNGNKNGNKNG